METALATSLQVAAGNRLAHSAEARRWLSDENSLRASKSSQELGRAPL
jgi:hypothetical protein